MYQTISVRLKERLAIFCLFISSLSIPGSESIAVIERANYYQIAGKAVLICIPLILFPVSKYLKAYQVKKYLALLLFGGYGILTSLWSPMPIFSTMRALSFIIVILGTVSIIQAYMQYSEEFYSLLLYDLYLITGIIILFFTILGGIGLDIAWRKVYLPNLIVKRLGGDILPPNTLGALAGLHFILIFTISTKNKFSVFFSVLFSIYVLTQTDSRGALITLLFSWGIVFVVFSFFTFNLKRVGAVFIVLSVLAGLFIFIEDRSIELIANSYSRYNSSEEFKTLTGRTHIWEGIFSQGFVPLLTGNGFGVLSEMAVIKYLSITTTNAHNGFLQIIAGTGIGGFSLFLLFLVNLTKHVKKTVVGILMEDRPRKTTYILVFLIIFVLINNFVESSFGGQIVPQLIIFLFVSAILVNDIKPTTK